MSKTRGVYEKERGSNIWWVRYADSSGKLRREKAGPKSWAIKLYQKRKTEVLQRKKLPEQLRSAPVSFDVLMQDALEYSRSRKRSYLHDQYRAAKLLKAFGGRVAEGIVPQDIERWFAKQEHWKPATINRYRALLSLTYRLGIKNGKVQVNPARMIESRRENNARERYLSAGEEARFRSVVDRRCPERMPEFDIALHTGMRRGEQYGCQWNWVDLEARILTIPRSKHGERRRVYLNDVAVQAFRNLWGFSSGSGAVFSHLYRKDTTRGARHWFEDCRCEANLADFRWHDIRHTFGSRLVMAGVDLRTVQELMGHKTISMTVRYAHLAPQHQLAAVQRLCGGGASLPASSTDTRTRDSKNSQSVVL